MTSRRFAPIAVLLLLFAGLSLGGSTIPGPPSSGGGGGGDNVLINSNPIVDPDFNSSGSISFTPSGSSVQADLKDDTVDASKLADGDLGDVSISGGAATVDAVGGVSAANVGTALSGAGASVTAANLTTLTDGSNADALHTHSVAAGMTEAASDVHLTDDTDQFLVGGTSCATSAFCFDPATGDLTINVAGGGIDAAAPTATGSAVTWKEASSNGNDTFAIRAPASLVSPTDCTLDADGKIPAVCLSGVVGDTTPTFLGDMTVSGGNLIVNQSGQLARLTLNGDTGTWSGVMRLQKTGSTKWNIGSETATDDLLLMDENSNAIVRIENGGTADSLSIHPDRIDVSATGFEGPNGASLPATCNVGQWFQLTSASSGSQLYACTAGNTWTLQAGGGGGSSAFSAITSGTNTTSAMFVGTGASLSTSGTGTISATSATSATTAASLAANGSNCPAGQAPLGVDASGNAEGCFIPSIGSAGFDVLSSGTNTAAAMVVGTGSSLSATGSGTIAATTSSALAANGSNCSAGSYPLGVDAQGNSEGCAVLNPTFDHIQAGTLGGTTLTVGAGASIIPFGGAVYATSLYANGSNCASGYAPLGVSATGVAEGCFDVLTQVEGDLKAPLASPVFTGNPTAPTPSTADSDTSLATTAFVHNVADNYVLLTGHGNGITESGGAFSVILNGTADGSGVASSLSGMEFTATSGVALLQGCSDGQGLFWNAGTSTWDCGTVAAGSVGFDAISGGTNSTAAMVVGTGGSLTTSGSGTITATSSATATALAANGGNCATGEYPLGVDASGAVEGCTDATTEITTVVDTKSAATSTDNAFARFDGSSGDVQDSQTTEDDSGNVSISGTLSIGTGSGPTCLIFRDSDDAGYTACQTLNGSFVCEVDTNGICGDAT